MKRDIYGNLRDSDGKIVPEAEATEAEIDALAAKAPTQTWGKSSQTAVKGVTGTLRTKLQRRITAAFLRDFEAPALNKKGLPEMDWQGRPMSEGEKAIRNVRMRSPATYVKIMAQLLPKDVEVAATGDLASFLEELNRQRNERVIGGNGKSRLSVPDRDLAN